MSGILIVEDERIIAEDIRMTIKEFGYHVIGIADNAEQAYELFEKNAPDLILMDIKIKGEMNGIKLAKKIMSKRKTAIIFLTSFADDKIWREIHSIENSGYLLKPFSCSKLKEIIEEAIRGNSVTEDFKMVLN